MNEEVLKYIIREDYRLLIEEDGFNPEIAKQIVYIRYLNGVYDNMELSN